MQIASGCLNFSRLVLHFSSREFEGPRAVTGTSAFCVELSLGTAVCSQDPSAWLCSPDV